MLTVAFVLLFRALHVPLFVVYCNSLFMMRVGRQRRISTD